MFKFIVMCCGYAENCHVAPLIYQHHSLHAAGFHTRKEAITELALDIYAKYFDVYLSVYANRYTRGLASCCIKSLSEAKAPCTCSTCGTVHEDVGF